MFQRFFLRHAAFPGIARTPVISRSLHGTFINMSRRSGVKLGPSQGLRSTVETPEFLEDLEREGPFGHPASPLGRQPPRRKGEPLVRRIKSPAQLQSMQQPTNRPSPPHQLQPAAQPQSSYPIQPPNEPQFHHSPLQDRRIPSPRGSPSPAKNIAAVPSKASGGIPDPTSAYLESSLLPLSRLSQPQHLLVVVDLNGTILYRPNRKSPTKFIARPHAHRFLKYCIDTFTVVIWSSAKPENVRYMSNDILNTNMKEKVAAIWGRDKFNLTPNEYNSKVQCYKRLTRVWADNGIQRHHPDFVWGGKWDQTNTVLIDDSFYKGRSEPYNLIEIPEFAGNLEDERGDILPQVHDYLNKLSLHDNVSAYLRSNPWKAMMAPEGPPGFLAKGY